MCLYIECLLHVKCFMDPTSLKLTLTLQDRHYDPHFSNKKNGASERLTDFPKVTQLINAIAGTQTLLVIS